MLRVGGRGNSSIGMICDAKRGCAQMLNPQHPQHPQQPVQRRSERCGGTPQESGKVKAREAEAKGGRAHGQDKDKGGGQGGGVPPDQQTVHP
jgi:hypothetical protein